MIHIFGFSGKIGVGKNYIAEKIFGKKIYELGFNVHILSFGEQLKYELGSRFSLIKDDVILEMNTVFDDLFIKKSATTREKLQIYGTEYCRKGPDWTIKDDFVMYNEENIWIKGLYLQIKNILLKSYEPHLDIFIIPDVRFMNESDFIKKLGGKIIRITSPSRMNEKLIEEARKNYTNDVDIDNFISRVTTHQSETELDNCIFDCEINNEPFNINVYDDVYRVLRQFVKK
jgi:hypothetical protein